MNLKQNERELYMMACAASEFMKKHDPSVASWDDPVGWCQWYLSHGFMVILHDPVTYKIVALAAARPVLDPVDGNIPYKYVENGPCIFIDFLAIEDHNSMILPAFAIEMRQRFGQREMVAFHRIRTHEYDGFLRNISRINNIRTPYHGTEIAT